MRAYIDNQPIAIPLGSIAEAIAAARTKAQASGRIVVDVLVDGQRLDDEALESPSTKPAGDIEFKCITAEPRALVAESFRDVADILEQNRPAQQRAAIALQTGALDQAFAELDAPLQAWGAVQRVAEQGPALLGVPLAALAGGPAADDQLVALADVLRRVKESVNTQDWATLADVLEADLDAASRRWSALLRHMAGNASPGGIG